MKLYFQSSNSSGLACRQTGIGLKHLPLEHYARWFVAAPAGMLKAVFIDGHTLSSTAGAGFLRDACMHIGGGTIVLVAVLFFMLSSESDLRHQTRRSISHRRPHTD